MIRQGVTLIATAVLGAGLLAGCGSSGESAEAPAEESKTEVGTGSVGGEPVVDDDVGFQVMAVNKLPKEQLPAIDDSDSYELPDGSAAWTADVKVTNNGAESATPVCNANTVVAIDQKDREYEMATAFDVLAGEQTGKSIFCVKVEPGSSKTGTVYFTTPNDSEIESFRLYNNTADGDTRGNTYVVIKR